jgi:hypothetical protein
LARGGGLPCEAPEENTLTIQVHNITIDGSSAPEGAPRWDPAQYERVVRRNLIHVFNSPVGHCIIPQITRQLRIIPHPTFAPDGADAFPDDWAAARLRGATVFQCGMPAEPGQPAMGEPLPDAAPGTGVGSASTIRFTPADWYDPSRRYGGFISLLPSRREGAPGTYSDEVLCHELVHSIRQMRGVMQCVGRGDIYATHEEFCAVEVANVYASCRGRPIAGDYWHSTVREGLVSPFGEQTARQRDEDRWIERMRTEQPGFVYALSRISRESASYNPFRPRSPYVRYVNRPY